MAKQHFNLGILLLVVEAIFAIIMALMVAYHPEANASNTKNSASPAQGGFDHNNGIFARKHPVFQDVHVMVFIGFGFLMTFLKRYGFSAIGFNLLVASLNVQWSILVHGFLHRDHDSGNIDVSITNLLSADLSTAAILISMGAVLGKTSPIQLIIMGLIETVLFAINEYVGEDVLKAIDAGESMYVHAFGAYFGLAVSLVLGHGKLVVNGHEKEGSSYNSDMFAMIGTVFLWLFWPSFNSGTLSGDEQHRAVINTYLSLTACCVTAFAVSSIVNKEHKFDMVHIQNATLAGGVAIGTSCNMMIYPYGALIVGMVGGAVSVIGYRYLTPFILAKLKIHDTCGVHNLHGMPGVVAGIVGAIMAGMASEAEYSYSLYQLFPARAPPSNSTDFREYAAHLGHLEGGESRSAKAQAGYQFLALAVTLAIAIIGGAITGFILKMLKPIIGALSRDQFYDDEPFWELPADMESHNHEIIKKGDDDEKTVEAFVCDTSHTQNA